MTGSDSPQTMTLAERAKEWFAAWENHHLFPKRGPMAGSDTVPSHIYGEWQMELALYEAAQMLHEVASERDPTAELVEAVKAWASAYRHAYEDPITGFEAGAAGRNLDNAEVALLAALAAYEASRK